MRASTPPTMRIGVMEGSTAGVPQVRPLGGSSEAETKLQLRENRPSLTERSVWKTMNSDEPEDVMDDVCIEQNVPSFCEVALEPSYSITLS